MPRSRYSTVLGRRYILIRPRTLLPAAAVDAAGYALRGAWRGAARLARRGSRDEPRTAPVERVLAIRLDHIGDVLITTPALRLLRERFPRARLDVVAGPWAADLLRDDPDVDRVITLDAAWYGGRSGLAASARLFARLRRERYDLVIDFRGDLRHLLLARLTGARRVLGHAIRGGGFLLSEEVPYDEQAHEVERALGLVEALGGGAGRPTAALQHAVRPEDAERARRLFAEVGIDPGRLVVALCPTSRNPSRWWRGERFADVARHLHARYGAQVLVLGDAVSAGVDATLLAPGLAGVRSLVGRTSLRVFAAALARVDFVISVESSPIHFASALRKPVVTVFGGSSLPQQWGPYGTVHRIVHREVACSPCHLIRCPLPEVLCMEAITAADVARACDDLLGELAAREPAIRAKLGRGGEGRPVSGP